MIRSDEPWRGGGTATWTISCSTWTAHRLHLVAPPGPTEGRLRAGRHPAEHTNGIDSDRAPPSRPLLISSSRRMRSVDDASTRRWPCASPWARPTSADSSSRETASPARTGSPGTQRPPAAGRPRPAFCRPAQLSCGPWPPCAENVGEVGYSGVSPQTLGTRRDLGRTAPPQFRSG